MAARKKRKCIKKRRVSGVLRCVKFTRVRATKKASGGRVTRPGLLKSNAARNTKMFWLDRDWCRGKRSGFPRGYSATGLKCNRKLPYRGSRWPSVSSTQMANRTKRARRVSWPKA